MTIEEIRARYNEHIRKAESDLFAQREIVGSVYRYRLEAEKFGMVLYTELSEENADDAIAEQVTYFRSLGYPFEWKHSVIRF